MLKRIKNFFKWIADHTGISWIAKKVSSGWNWLFSSKVNTAQENTPPERPLDDKKHESKDNLVPIVETPSVSNQQTLDKIEESMSEVNNETEVKKTIATNITEKQEEIKTLPVVSSESPALAKQNKELLKDNKKVEQPSSFIVVDIIQEWYKRTVDSISSIGEL